MFSKNTKSWVSSSLSFFCVLSAPKSPLKGDSRIEGQIVKFKGSLLRSAATIPHRYLPKLILHKLRSPLCLKLRPPTSDLGTFVGWVVIFPVEELSSAGWKDWRFADGPTTNISLPDLLELPMGDWFCSRECSGIYCSLQNLLVSGGEKLSDFLLDITLKKQNDKGLVGVATMDVRFRLLSSKMSSDEISLLLGEACDIFHERFNSMIDPASGEDDIPSIIYGKSSDNKDSNGMYCAILTVNSIVVSAGLLRVFGCDIAELPLIATTMENQGKGKEVARDEGGKKRPPSPRSPRGGIVIRD